jgi:uncharacterized Ntn-hydrolase superfamily protein
MMITTKKDEPIATFSIVARDPDKGELGIAVQSKFLAVGAFVPWAAADVGAIATQSWANLSYGPQGLELLKQGLSAQETLARLIADDEKREYRQVGIVDAKGGSATFTGKECFNWAGGVNGTNYSCQGNILVNAATITVMAETFLNVQGDLAERLLQALDAGGNAGGDSRGKQSAALLVVKTGAGYGGFNDRYIDLRVDDHPEPIQELIRLHKLYKLYFYKTDPARLLKLEGQLATDTATMLQQLGYYAGKIAGAWSQELQDALMKYSLIENFDERIAETGYIDGEVFDFMSQQTSQSQDRASV